MALQKAKKAGIGTLQVSSARLAQVCRRASFIKNIAGSE
jgi:hypothetical protein